MYFLPGSDATSATVKQIRRLVGLLPEDGEVPLFVLDGSYDPIAIGHDRTGENIEVGNGPRPSSADPGAGTPGVSATSCDDRHTSQSTESPYSWTRTPERDPKTAENPLSAVKKAALPGIKDSK